MVKRAASLCVALAFAMLAVAQSQRVRKELRQMNDTEYSGLLRALRVMTTVSTEEGQALYGSRYKEYDYFIIKHAVAAVDPRGDQGHNGPNFMTFHRAFLLELEQSILAVAPETRAIPYLDVTLDTRGGEYYGTNRSVFTDKYIGSIDCASGAANNCTVTDGAFPYKRISTFNHSRYGRYAHIYNGSLSTGLLRGVNNANPNPYLTRFPNINNQFQAVAFGTFIPAAMWWLNPTNGMSSGQNYSLSRQDFTRCVNASAFTDWMQWNYCADFTSYALSLNYTSDFERYTQVETGMATTLHAGMHFVTGGLSDGLLYDGDMKDTTTSPNEVLMFLMWHANVDRNAIAWQTSALALNASMEYDDVMYGYPKNKTEYPHSFDGCYLLDVITSNFPFVDLFDNQTNATTHFDMMNLTYISSIYTYDDLGNATNTTSMPPSPWGNPAPGFPGLGPLPSPNPGEGPVPFPLPNPKQDGTVLKRHKKRLLMK